MDKILIIGACGQLGTELTLKLRELKGTENVIASDLRDEPIELLTEGPYEKLNIMNKEAFQIILEKHEINQVYHLAAVLSAKGEQNPHFAWQLNMESLLTVLEAGKDKLNKIYWPSSIAVFGPDTPKENTPQNTVMSPNTVYGISKLAGERWCEYYFEKYGVDVRSLRYPGLIGYKAMPGGGTTDYAVDIFHKAIAGENYECFLSENSMLPMMYMDDAVKATIDLMETDAENVKVRSSYNLAAMSFTPKEIAAEIRNHYPDFKITYNPDFRQKIADSWPGSIDDSAARNNWGWQHAFGLKELVDTMITNLKNTIVFD
ncbi:NAD-dependent epimerase/dehydratase family protein [Ekhidna sp.]|uniref:NAD-dependent epimerase/dehydratase family protein n=1 Tax=Ekhidna sp. TaxID=2608089 RepID=UPI0032EED5FC